MSAGVVLHAELWPFEVEGGTGRTQYTSTFATLVHDRAKNSQLLNDRNSACKRTRTLIRAPMESPPSQLSIGARINVWVVLHAELWSLEVEVGARKAQTRVSRGFQRKWLAPAEPAWPKTSKSRFSETFVATPWSTLEFSISRHFGV